MYFCFSFVIVDCLLWLSLPDLLLTLDWVLAGVGLRHDVIMQGALPHKLWVESVMHAKLLAGFCLVLWAALSCLLKWELDVLSLLRINLETKRILLRLEHFTAWRVVCVDDCFDFLSWPFPCINWSLDRPLEWWAWSTLSLGCDLRLLRSHDPAH